MEELFQVFWKKGWGFLEIGPSCPPFWPFIFSSELLWRWWLCHLPCYCVTVSYNEAQGLVEVNSFTILDPIDAEPLYTLL